MWTLAILLPLMIGDKVPEDDPHWLCFLLLLEITRFCSARTVSTASAAVLAAFIEQHHQEFCRCYPTVKMTPKTHYMVHFPQQMLK